jgi:hypothetical protein
MRVRVRSSTGFTRTRKSVRPRVSSRGGRPTLTVFTIAKDLEKIRYPWKESIRSALPVADQILVCECGSTDGTAEQLAEMVATEPKIRVIRGEWGDHFSVISRLANVLISEVSSEWHFFLQADEALHDRSYEPLMRALRESRDDVLAARYTHFCGDFRHTWPFMYERAARIARRSSGVRYDGDACEISRPRSHTTAVDVDVYHYGKVHLGREHEAAEKEFHFQQLYKDVPGFPDPRILKTYREGRIDYQEVLQEERRNGLIRPFTGRHPAAMLTRVRAIESSYGLEPRPEDL